MTNLAEEMLARTHELVSIASVSHNEHEIADFVHQRLNSTDLEVLRIGDNLVARTNGVGSQRLLLAGHLDTVPPSDNQPILLSAGRLQGLGAADMKGGLAAMLWLAETVKEPCMDITWIFYAAEEVASKFNGLGEIERERPDLLQADAAILGEPTSAVVEAGCQGTLRIKLTLKGKRAHTARPWMGVNAVHRLAPVLQKLASLQSRQPSIGGCLYKESLQAVGVGGGVAGNVVPDEATITINHRFAPDRDENEALAYVKEILGPCLQDGDEIELLDSAPAAPPQLEHPIISALVEASREPARAKLGWTDVARFARLGVPSANFGPGASTLAHMAGEWVGGDELEAVAMALFHLVTA